MNRKASSLFVLAMAGMLSFTSCGDNKKEEEKASQPMQHEMHKEDAHEGHADADMHGEKSEKAAEMGNAEFKDEQVKKIFNSYLSVKDALVASDAEAAKNAAAELQAALKDKKEVAAIAQNLATAEDINKQREIFSKLTKAMEPVLNGSLSSGKIYKQFCPMAFEGKGDYWFSNSDQIRNPYYGDKMLKCGRVEKTIM